MDSEVARARIAEREDLNVFISLTDERGDGCVVAVKDIIRVRGTVTTGGGAVLPRIPDVEDAPVIAALRRHGCIVVGKANLHEWAYGPTSDSPHYGAVRNPRDPSRSPGGSSGGSGAAVAAGMCDWAIGTDTGGSIRIPAALCGVVGIKPTRGVLSTEGVLPLSRTLDTVGPLAPDVATAARALEMMGLPRERGAARGASLGDFRLAVPAGWVFDLDETVGEAWARVSDGVPEIPFPDRQRIVDTALTVHFVEASAYHRAWLEADPSRYGEDVRDLLQTGMTISGVDYVRALEELPRLQQEMAEAMRHVDALLVPTTAIVAPPVGSRGLREPLARFTRPFSASGQPVISVPVRSSGLPVGVQVVGHLGKDWDLVEVALAFERAWAPLADGSERSAVEA